MTLVHDDAPQQQIILSFAILTRTFNSINLLLTEPERILVTIYVLQVSLVSLSKIIGYY